jgi:hypothetical protein
METGRTFAWAAQRSIIPGVVTGLFLLALTSCGGTQQQSAQRALPEVHPKTGGFYIDVRLQSLRTHSSLLTLELSSNNRKRARGGATLTALPCAHGHYLFTATEESLSSVPEGRYMAHLTMGGATLPPGIICDHPVPVALGPGKLTIEITGPGHPKPLVYFKISGRRIADGSLVGLIPEAANTTLCAGKYRFVARLFASNHHLRFEYPFVLSDINGGNC